MVKKRILFNTNLKKAYYLIFSHSYADMDDPWEFSDGFLDIPFNIQTVSKYSNLKCYPLLKNKSPGMVKKRILFNTMNFPVLLHLFN